MQKIVVTVDTNALGEALRSKRVEEKLRLEDVAPIIGCNPSTLSRLERGFHDPNVALFFAACEWLGRPSSDFIKIKLAGGKKREKNVKDRRDEVRSSKKKSKKRSRVLSLIADRR